MQEPFTISNEIDGSVTNYTVTYSDSIFGTSCGSFNIPASDCEEFLKCSHTFDILTSSFCPPTTAITVKVYAINVLGRGPPSTGLVRGKQKCTIIISHIVLTSLRSAAAK